MLMVRHIENGTVIDHIQPGKAPEVLKVLGGANGNTVVMAINVESKKGKSKDILKLEDVFVPKKKLDLISLISPGATINVIKKGKVSEKIRAHTPKEIVGVLKCINPKCITNMDREPVSTTFKVMDDGRLRCGYCGTEFKTELMKVL